MNFFLSRFFFEGCARAVLRDVPGRLVLKEKNSDEK